MSLLLLLRHAKSGWALPGMRDFDRPLDETGRRDAAAIGAAMKRNGYRPNVIFCSSAARARETLECAAPYIDIRDAIYTPTLYSTDAGGYLETIRTADDAPAVLVVGHNPMMEDLGMALSGDGDETARHALHGGFPTSGLAAVRFQGSLAAAAPGQGFLEAFLTPEAD
ncbi:SixA phosphatase family protein [Arvimicrobium flavum]|uniref:SixA phosphatase family protein n=1 Tax=Arvimicrobium flavum TaxID=3393320 RepID=UPI00237B988E|nr:histidine phosphatase family protein [Mesorhizobium shangrilense]